MVINMTENQNLEYKEAWHDEYLKTICAFANASGGRLEIGKDDNGNVVGISHPQKLLEDIPNKIKNGMAIVTDITFHNKQYISISVTPYPSPISYRGRYYIRSGSTTQELTGIALDEFILRKQGLSWDGVPVPRVTLDDFEQDTFKQFRRKAVSTARLTTEDLNITNDDLLNNLRLYDGNYLKRAAMLIFHHDPENWFPGAFIKVGYFANDADIIFQDEIHGPLLTQADKAEELLYSKYFKGIISYEGMQRIETFPVPRQAFKEAIVNAIIHRDYSTGNPIHIHVYPNEVLIYNDGRIPESWTIETLFTKHTSVPFNPLIANAFFRSGQIESWGRGIEKITNSLKMWKMPKPFYRTKKNEVMIGFKIENQEIESIISQYSMKGEIDFGLNQTQELLLKIIRQSPDVTIKSMATILGLTENHIKKNTQHLKKIGLINRIGSNKKGYWEIKNDTINDTINDTVNVLSKNNVTDNNTNSYEDFTPKKDNEMYTEMYEIKYVLKYGLNETQQKILNILHVKPTITMDEIASEIGISIHGIDKNIRYLKKIGLIERAGSRKKGSWVIKNEKY